jgi:hypothetical protein
MFEQIYSSSKNLYVVNSPAPYANYKQLPNYTNLPGNAFVGALRLNNNKIEMFDGMAWAPVNSAGPTTISLSPEAEIAIDWARKKQVEEQREQEELEALAKAHPNIQSLVDEFLHIKSKLEVFKKLVKSYDSSNETV